MANKISELILDLQSVLALHGDLPIYHTDELGDEELGTGFDIEEGREYPSDYTPSPTEKRIVF